jgi:hypothetical protein
MGIAQARFMCYAYAVTTRNEYYDIWWEWELEGFQDLKQMIEFKEHKGFNFGELVYEIGQARNLRAYLNKQPEEVLEKIPNKDTLAICFVCKAMKQEIKLRVKNNDAPQHFLDVWGKKNQGV